MFMVEERRRLAKRERWFAADGVEKSLDAARRRACATDADPVLWLPVGHGPITHP